MGRADRVVFLVLACIAWSYVIARAVLVPVVHDEANVFYMFTLTGDFIPFVTKWDAANHFVFDALAQVSYFIFGQSLVALRMWSVLSFVVYAWYLWRSGEWFRSTFIRWCAWAGLLCVPFMIEFFSLARGYGLGLGFWTMALYHLVAFAKTRGNGDLTTTLSAMALACWSTLSLLMVWSGVLAFVTGSILLDRSAKPKARPLGIIALAGALPWVLAVLFAFGLKDHDALYAGTDRGYISGTIASLSGEVCGWWDSPGLVVIGVVVLAAAGLTAGRHLTDGQRLQQLALVLLFGVLVFDALLQSLTQAILGSHLPTDRAALFLLPPSILVSALSLDAISVRFSWVQPLAAFLLLLPFREIQRANVDHATFWRDQMIPSEFYHIIAERQQASDRLLLVGAQPFQAKSTWTFGMHQHGVQLNELDPLDFPQPNCDLMMIDTTTHSPPPGFRVIARGASGVINLIERETPLRTRLLIDSAMSIPMSTDEFRMIWTADASPYQGKDLVLEFRAWINAPRHLTKAMIFAVVEEDGGTKSCDRQISIDDQRGAMEEGPFAIALHLPRLGNQARRVQLGLYAPEWRPFALDSARIRVREIIP